MNKARVDTYPSACCAVGVARASIDTNVARLPAVWRDLWTEFATLQKTQQDEVDKSTLKELKMNKARVDTYPSACCAVGVARASIDTNVAKAFDLCLGGDLQIKRLLLRGCLPRFFLFGSFEQKGSRGATPQPAAQSVLRGHPLTQT
jgi:hypothetical protein